MPGVWIREPDGPAPTALAITGADGTARVAIDGPAAREIAVSSGAWTTRATLREPVTEVVVGQALELFVDVVHGRTGELLPGTEVRIGVRMGDPAPRTVVSGIGERIALPWPGDGATGPLATFEIVAPSSSFATTGAWVWTAKGEGHPGPVRVSLVAWPAAARTVRLLDAHEEPVAGAELSGARLGRGGPTVFPDPETLASARAAPTDAAGRTTVAGLPDMPGGVASLTFRAKAPLGGDGDVVGLVGTVEVPLGVRPATEPEAVLVADVLGLGGGAGDALRRGRFGTRGGIGARSGVVLTVRVFARDGSPARGVSVSAGAWTGTTDAEGVATLRIDTETRGPLGHARPAPTTVLAWDERFLPTAAPVPAGIAGEVVIRESAPRRVRVEVVTADGTLLPAATVSTETVRIPSSDGSEIVATCPLPQFDAGGALLLRPLTGPSGTIDVEAPAGVCVFRADAGGVFATVKSDAAFVRIVLPISR